MSVVLYVHNGEPYLADAVGAILAQTHQRFELCVVDDGSTDGTAELLRRTAARDERVRVVHQERRGRDRLHETFNAALGMARHRLVAIANADDVWLPTKLERQVAAFDAQRDLQISFHDATFIDADGCVLFGGFRTIPSPHLIGSPKPSAFIGGNPIPNPTVLFDRTIVRRIGLQEVGQMHDHQFWFKACVHQCRFEGLPDRLIRYRVHDDSHSTAAHRKDVIAAAHRASVEMMIDRYPIELLVPELAFVDEHDVDSRAWAWSRLAVEAWRAPVASPRERMWSTARDLWSRARRLSDNPAIEAGLASALLADGDELKAMRLLRPLADRGWAPAAALLADPTSVDAVVPTVWSGCEPAVAALVDCPHEPATDLASAGSCGSPDTIQAADHVLVVDDQVHDAAEVLGALVGASMTGASSVIALVVDACRSDLVVAAYERLVAEAPEAAKSMDIEVVRVLPGDLPSIVAAHRLEGAGDLVPAAD